MGVQSKNRATGQSRDHKQPGWIYGAIGGADALSQEMDPLCVVEFAQQGTSSYYTFIDISGSSGHGTPMTIIPTLFKPVTCTRPPVTIQNTCTYPPILKGKASDVHRIASASAKSTTHPNVDPEVFQMRHQLGARNVS
ncbi:hypothetical protein Tco_0838014 [Tanacetum coccineum]